MESYQGIKLDIKQGVTTHQRNYQMMTMTMTIIVIKKIIPHCQSNQLPPLSSLSPPLPPNQNMNDGNGKGNNPPNGQNNIIAQTLTALA